MGVYLSKANVAMESDSVEGQGMRGVVGDIQGWRRNMEDAHIATTDIRKESGNMDLNADDMSVFGVFDGHGGKEVAKFTQIKFVRELTQTKAFQEGRYSDALRSAFHRIDDMLEDKKYAKVLAKLRALPNPSDKTEVDSDGEDSDSGRGKRAYSKFNPKDPQWESDGEDDDEQASSLMVGGKKCASDDGSGSANGKPKTKKMISKKEAIELFTQLLLEERNKKMNGGGGDDNKGEGGSSSSGFAKAMKELGEREDSEDDEEDTGDGSSEDNYMKEWRAYHYAAGRIPGDRPRPSRHSGPASVRVGAGEGPQCALRDHAVQAGCTAVVVFRVGDILYCGNAGDSRAVLCRGNGEVHAMSEDHKPTSITELSRIEGAGGFVNANGRVNANLNLSRSLGDMKYKQVPKMLPKDQMITAEPDITVTQVHPDDRFFVIACDGVWDVLGNQEICDFVSARLDKGMDVEAIVRDVFTHCVADDPRKTQGIGGDNMTCMIVLLNQ